MKPGDRVIWVRSPGRSFQTGWWVEAGVIVRMYRQRLMIRVRLAGSDKVVMLNPDNVLREESADLRPASEVGAVRT